jgi:hypothetical protein
MRALVCAAICTVVAAIGFAAPPAFAQADGTAAPFWKTVQATCDATAAKPPGALGRRIAQTAIDEQALFDGHRIDAGGRLFRFGLTEAEQEKENDGHRQAGLGQQGWRQVMKYWRALYGDDAAAMLEARGYRDASTSAQDTRQDTQGSALLRTTAAWLLSAAEKETDPAEREILREAALRAAIVDTPWSAAFVSYVIRQSGVAANAFQFSNAHRAFIYDAFAASAAEAARTGQESNDRLYRACPVATTRPRVGDLLCSQREPALAAAGDEAVRERIRAELAGTPDARSVRRSHCEVVAFIDAPARKMYTIGGNVAQSVTVRQMNLRRGLKVSLPQKGNCGRAGHWNLPSPSAALPGTANLTDKCSLNDQKWFVLLQLR